MRRRQHTSYVQYSIGNHNISSSHLAMSHHAPGQGLDTLPKQLNRSLAINNVVQKYPDQIKYI